MTVDEPFDDDAGRKGRKGRSKANSVAQRLKNQPQLSPSSQGDVDDREPEPVMKIDIGKYDKATIRIIAQFLDNVGLKNSVEALVEETGFTIETSAGARIRASIMKGNYDMACNILKQARDLPAQTAKHASYIIQCFKLSDLVRKNRLFDAIYTMQTMCQDVLHDRSKNLEYFDSFIKDVMLGGTRYQHVDAASSRNSQLAFLEEILPSDFILPQHRLQNILQKIHGPSSDEKAEKLLRDETSTGYKAKPYSSVQVWDHHTSPVFCVKFSRDGKLLASGGKSNSITIFKVSNGKLDRLGELASIIEGDIAYMEFCQQNRFLAVCGPPSCKYNLTIFDVARKSVFRTLRVNNGHEDVIDIGSYFTCASFLTSGRKTMVVAGNELGALKVFDLSLEEVAPPMKQIPGFRVRTVYGMKNGDSFLTVDTHNRVRLYSLSSDMSGSTICKEEVTILNMTVHPSEKFVLTVTECNLRLWDIRTHTLVRMYSGACQREEFAKFSIHATFGGVHQNFIATGSIGRETDESLQHNQKRLKKDGRVVVWSVDESRPRYSFVGHKGHVNAVAWSPTDPTMIVSCGDDATIRVWSMDRSETSDHSEVIPRMITRRQKYLRNGGRRPSLSRNGSTSASSKTDELINETSKLSTKVDFETDLNMEKLWIEKAKRPAWRIEKASNL